MIRWPAPERALVARTVLSFHTGQRVELPRGVVVGAGRILGFFDPEDRAARRGWDVPLEDLGDTVLMPGFIDAHNHLPSAVVDTFAVRTAQVLSTADLVSCLAAATAGTANDRWVITEHALSSAQFPPGDLLSADVLDRSGAQNPIAVRLGAHAMVLNSRALRLTGIEAHRGDPPGGIIERDAAGRPTGVIREYGAMQLVFRCFDPRSANADLGPAIRATQREYARSGVTTVRVTGLREGELGWFHRVLGEDGHLATRVFGGPRLDPTAGLDEQLAVLAHWPAATGFGNEWLGHDAVKIFVDHGIETVTDGSEPSLLMDGRDLFTLVAEATRRGWAVTCHAATQLGVDAALDAFELARARSTAALTVEHGFDISDVQLLRMAAHDIWWSTQPAVIGVELGRATTSLHGRRLVPLRTATRLGVRCVLGSDWNGMPGERGRPFQPMASIALAVERRSLWDVDFGPDEAVSPETALYLHTHAGARLLGRRDLGLLAPGAYADLVGVAADPTSCLRPAVHLSIVGGRDI